MDTNSLDNPVWNALNSHHRHLAIKGKLSARYQPDTLMAAAMPNNNAAGFRDLRDLVESDETIGILGTLPETLPGWEVLQTVQVYQMICDDLVPAAQIGAVTLTTEDVPDMLDLIALAQPGPFLGRTIEMGQYLGVRQDGRLVAMAGERLHPMGFCEISAVCTHPDYRGRGYASALTTMVAKIILARQEIPFLHLALTNDMAMKIYNKLGFRLRTEIQISMLQRSTK